MLIVGQDSAEARGMSSFVIVKGFAFSGRREADFLIAVDSGIEGESCFPTHFRVNQNRFSLYFRHCLSEKIAPMIPNKEIFISHNTDDDAFVKQLREALELHKIPTWVDSRQMRGSDSLWPKVADAIANAGSVIVVLSLNAINSAWIMRELDEARLVAKTKHGEDYRVIPLMLPGIGPNAVKLWFREDIMALPVDTSVPDGLQEAMPGLLAALGLQLPKDHSPAQMVAEVPLSELVLEFISPATIIEGNQTLATAKARLKYEPANRVQLPIETAWFNFISPIGLVEADELNWYLEKYLVWPVGQYAEKAKRIETNLSQWGNSLFAALFENPNRREVLREWQRSGSASTDLSFSIYLGEVFDSESQQQEAHAASQLLSIPWELLHDGHGFLFQGANSVRIRRRLSNDHAVSVRKPSSPLRILLVSPRPGSDSEWIDPRISALPLVEVIEGLGALAELTILQYPNFKDFVEALEQANGVGKPFDVVHFDGHGVYDKRLGLGALCFESYQDREKTSYRELELVHADKLGAELQRHNIPLVVLEACQSAEHKEDVSASVATRLLREGVASVVSMTHNVLVVTASKFVKAFYKSLASGARIGTAMLAGQKALHRDTFRMQMSGVGKVHLQDWFVPVLFQDREDPQLFKRIPSKEREETNRKTKSLHLGSLPEPPSHQFSGRDHELLEMERMLWQGNYVVIRGIGGLGKTTLAAELARWLIRTGRFDRAAFVSLENYVGLHSMIHDLGNQLLPKLSAAALADDEQAFLEIRREIEGKRVLVVFDNMESVLPEVGKPLEYLTQVLFDFIKRLRDVSSQTRLIFTSREPLPNPFHEREIQLHSLHTAQAIDLVRNVLTQRSIVLPDFEKGDSHLAIQELIKVLKGHPRALVLIAASLADGISKTTDDIVSIIHRLEQDHKGNREFSLLASLELSLRRLTKEQREIIKPLAVFQGGGGIETISHVLEMDLAQGLHLIKVLEEAGLFERQNMGHSRMDPALPSLLAIGQTSEKLSEYRKRLAVYLYDYIRSRESYITKNETYNEQVSSLMASMMAGMFQLEIPNLMSSLEEIRITAPPQVILEYSKTLSIQLARIGLVEKAQYVDAIRREAVSAIQYWSHAKFEAERFEVYDKKNAGMLEDARSQAQVLKTKISETNPDAFIEVEYDIAISCVMLGQVFLALFQHKLALNEFQIANERFQKLKDSGNHNVDKELEMSLLEIGNCLFGLNRLEEALLIYQQSIEQGERIGDVQNIALANRNIGQIFLMQGRFLEAREKFVNSKKLYQWLQQIPQVASSLEPIALTYQHEGNLEMAEQEFVEAAKIYRSLGNQLNEGRIISQLGLLYMNWGKFDEAEAFLGQAADMLHQSNLLEEELVTLNNLVVVLLRVGRNTQVRKVVNKAIESGRRFKPGAEHWIGYHLLACLEKSIGNKNAAELARREAIHWYLLARGNGWVERGINAKNCETTFLHIQHGNFACLDEEIESAIIEQPNNLIWPKLKEISKGSRNQELAWDWELDYEEAVELALLIGGLVEHGL